MPSLNRVYKLYGLDRDPRLFHPLAWISNCSKHSTKPESECCCCTSRNCTNSAPKVDLLTLVLRQKTFHWLFLRQKVARILTPASTGKILDMSDEKTLIKDLISPKKDVIEIWRKPFFCTVQLQQGEAGKNPVKQCVLDLVLFIINASLSR